MFDFIEQGYSQVAFKYCLSEAQKQRVLSVEFLHTEFFGEEKVKFRLDSSDIFPYASSCICAEIFGYNFINLCEQEGKDSNSLSVKLHKMLNNIGDV